MGQKSRPRRSMADLIGEEPQPKKRGRPVEPHRVRLANAQAELAEIRAARLRGELVAAADVQKRWASIVADVRQRFLAVPARLAERSDLTRKQAADLDREIRAVLTALGSQGGVGDAGRPPTA